MTVPVLATVGVLPLANHSSDSFAVDALMFLVPVIALAVLLWVWNRRGAEQVDTDADAGEPRPDDGRGAA